MEGYNRTIRNAVLEKESIRETIKYVRRYHRVFVTDNFGSSGEKRKSIVLVAGGSKEGGASWVAKVLLSYRINVRGSIESQEYVFLEHVEKARPIDVVDETFECVCLGWRSDDGVDRRWRLGTGPLEHRRLIVREWFLLTGLSTLQGFVNVLRANYEIILFTEKFLGHCGVTIGINATVMSSYAFQS